MHHFSSNSVLRARLALFFFLLQRGGSLRGSSRGYQVASVCSRDRVHHWTSLRARFQSSWRFVSPTLFFSLISLRTRRVADLSISSFASSSIDFAYGSQDIKWSFSMELPDEGTYAFLLPPREIRFVAISSRLKASYLLSAFADFIIDVYP